ncbi:hypothetical protein CY34DRAFT_614483 [Suillus luteus UH-Slu-Lm8-n1]|uniref:Uncharacterized protein n=1 Tax=Suillus luteus UH-Slu-Lm8-n1 TaxID=930992 RepID=A0A0D0A3I4_9AGAM|nr:hypothetical protein CY34DRAFT_614483 [Suillus luteus UH-Slu-Lm8-n1]
MTVFLLSSSIESLPTAHGRPSYDRYDGTIFAMDKRIFYWRFRVTTSTLVNFTLSQRLKSDCMYRFSSSLWTR